MARAQARPSVPPARSARRGRGAGTFALALDGDKRPVATCTTNAGHLLWSRAVTREHAQAVTDHLLGSDMFSGWGIRTLSARHPVFNPMSYHNGSVWPHDNALS